MADTDEWGANPQVRFLRRAFALIEKAQTDLLSRLNIPPLDVRLRRIREATLRLFEEGGMRAGRSGIVETDEEIALLYVYCLARTLTAEGIPVGEDLLPAHEKIAKFMKETLK